MTFFKRLTEFLFFTPEFSAQGRLATQLLAEELGGLSFTGSCNTANNRKCWSEGFNITTDYEKHVPDGIERKFYLEVDNHEIAPDGYLVQRMLFNGTYPGPTLEGNWGDTFKITIKNKLKNHNGTSVHWHGIHQRNSNWMDGVSGVTECPIPVSLHLHNSINMELILEARGRENVYLASHSIRNFMVSQCVLNTVTSVFNVCHPNSLSPPSAREVNTTGQTQMGSWVH
ncbi:oxidoreductase ptaE [Colletotrichum spaethianum]|uniref:Oxidoreductase ptaE n=1 Tax=Colletotrichum spaethianum TaxID=700344 RepID=A0AA37P6V4_9PEZI|nr:oxidoreductase ptaE [Colletotrichum spaethianum]GKT40624.1 oxidoreductase ptaE [Colletotrichum spaethianum]